MLLPANLSGKELLLHYINHKGLFYKKRVKLYRFYRYSYWLLRNFPVKFGYQIKDLVTRVTSKDLEGYCGRSFVKNGNPSHDVFSRCLGNVQTKFRVLVAIRPICIPYKSTKLEGKYKYFIFPLLLTEL